MKILILTFLLLLPLNTLADVLEKRENHQIIFEMKDERNSLLFRDATFKSEVLRNKCNTKSFDLFRTRLKRSLKKFKAIRSPSSGSTYYLDGKALMPLPVKLPINPELSFIYDLKKHFLGLKLRSEIDCRKSKKRRREVASNKKNSANEVTDSQNSENQGKKCAFCKWRDHLRSNSKFKSNLQVCVEKICPSNETRKLPNLKDEYQSMADRKKELKDSSLKSFDAEFSKKFDHLKKIVQKKEKAQYEFEKGMAQSQLPLNPSEIHHAELAKKLVDSLAVGAIYVESSNVMGKQDQVVKEYLPVKPGQLSARPEPKYYSKLNNQQKQTLKELYRSQFDSPILTKSAQQFLHPVSHIQELYSADTTANSVKKMGHDLRKRWYQLQKKSKSLGLKSGQLWPMSSYPDIIEKAALTGNITEAEAGYLVQSAGFLELLEKTHGNTEYRNKLVNFINEVIKSHPEVLADYQKELNSYRRGSEPNAYFPYSIADCRSAHLTSLLGQLPTKTLKKTRSNISRAKSRVLNLVKKNYSKPTSSQLSKRMKRWQAILPKSNAHFRSDLKQFLSDFDTNLSSLSKDSIESFGGVVDRLGQFCKNYSSILHPLADFAITTGDTFLVSQTSARSSEVGNMVIAHELAHMTSEVLRGKISAASRKKHDKVNACLDKKHISDSLTRNYAGIRSYRASEPLYREEDWADLVGALASKDDPINPWCLFKDSLVKTPNIYRQQFFGENQKNGPHSANMFRMLHIEQVKTGKLPKECSEALKTAPYPVEFKACL